MSHVVITEKLLLAHGKKMIKQSQDQIVENIKKDFENSKVIIWSFLFSFFLMVFLQPVQVLKYYNKITKLAQGLPIGGEIESLDDGTLFSAFKNRSKITSD